MERERGTMGGGFLEKTVQRSHRRIEAYLRLIDGPSVKLKAVRSHLFSSHLAHLDHLSVRRGGQVILLL